MRLTVASWLLLFVALGATSCIKEVERKVLVKPDSTAPDLGELDGRSELAEDGTDLELPDLADLPDLGNELVDTGADSVGPELVEQAEHDVGPEGGTFLYPGGVLLVVPPGAVSKTVAIGVAESSVKVPEGIVPVCGVFDLTPPGTKFAKSIVARLPLVSPGSVESDKWSQVKGFLGDVGEFEAVPAWPDLGSGLVWVQLEHFSAVFAGYVDSGGGCLDFELCNGKDDDCDGKTDEEPSFTELSGCKTGGVCLGKTTILCEDGGWKCDYSATNPTYFEESESICDDKDNDCDGLTDEGIGGDVKTLPGALCKLKGVCEDATIKAACVAGKWVCDYAKVGSYQGSEELLCDGKDNDCDGGVDEGTCVAMEPCPDDAACTQGHCALPLGGADVSFCTMDGKACLAVGDEAEIVEVPDGGQWCGGEGKSVLDCEGGTWSEPLDCALLFPLNPKCDPVLHECVGGCAESDECVDDGNKCNGIQICLDGACVNDKTTIVFCSESDLCADFACDPASGECLTQSKNEGAACDDGDSCTGAGKCTLGKCAKGEQNDCSDPNPCTADYCSEETGACAHDPLPNVGLACDDGDGCTSGDVCSDLGTCDGTSKPCSDGNPCTQDGCDPATGNCTATAVAGGPCEDSDPCTGTGLCNALGLCIAPPVDCNDYNDCTQDACGAGGACVHVPASEGLSCTYPSADPGAQDICIPLGSCDVSGVCKPGTDLCGCHVDSDCTAKDDNLCDGLLSCQFAGKVFDCLPLPDSAVKCDKGADTACRKSQCAPATGVCSLADEPDGTACSDGNACTNGDACLAGICKAGGAKLCDDDNDCTADTCDPAAGCKYTKVASGSPCQDGEPCSIGDKCDNSGFCVPGVPKTPPCVDDDICTEDTCTEDGSQCIFPPILGCCKSVADCKAGQVCFEQVCCGPICEDGILGKYECGDDGCGAACGICSGAAVCANRKCCIPNCTSPDKACGDDGCGGSCGTCPAGEVCTNGFACCKPNCAGRVCGSDGCGGSCGTCGAGTICAEAAGTCQPCTPVCEGKECGSDGCGGVCGNCPSGQPCMADGSCCVPSCAGLECGDNGCGGICGECASWEECVDGLCECAKCCTDDLDCGASDECSGTIPGTEEKICTEKLRLFFEGFEGQTPNQPSPTFKYSYASANPWLVKQAADEFGAHTGTFSLRYYRVAKDDNYFYRNVWMPSVPEGGKTLLSFFARCTNDKVVWSLEVSLGGKVAATVTNATCDGFWHRFVADVSTQPSGKSELRFRMVKNVQAGAEILIDDVALLVSACPQPIECVSWTSQSGECKLAAVAPGKCFIDLVCYQEAAVNPEISCAVCNPSTNSQDWTPDNALCDDGIPATLDICDIKNTKGCYNF